MAVQAVRRARIAFDPTHLAAYAPRVEPGGAIRLSSADFDAFLEPTRAGLATRGASAAQRRALRERIEAWAHEVIPRFAQIGLGSEVVVPDEVEQHLSSRSPRTIAQRVVFLRDDFARGAVPRMMPEQDPLREYAHLALTIDAVHVEVSLEIAPDAEADVRNLRARIADPTRLLELTTLLETLPEEFAIGVIGVPHFPRAIAATADDVRALLDDSQRNGRALWIGWSIKREIALQHSNELDDQLSDALVALAHVFKLIAWAPDNDFVLAGRRGAWRAGRARNEERRERGREERRKRRSVRKNPVRTEGSRREREDARRVSKEGESGPVSKGDRVEEAPKEGAAGRALPARRPVLSTTMRGRGARALLVTEVDPKAPIEKGTQVRVLAGPFANKIGVVQEIDPKGRARVRLGLLAATLPLRDLVASIEGARPRLASSHRRPRSARTK